MSTTARSAQSNKQNASLSTGPRTEGGKLRSKYNARRHGLAQPLGQIPGYDHMIEVLTGLYADGSSNLGDLKRARAKAESHIDMARIRQARFDLLEAALTADGAVDLDSTVKALDRVFRYERRALSKRKNALKKL